MKVGHEYSKLLSIGFYGELFVCAELEQKG